MVSLSQEGPRRLSVVTPVLTWFSTEKPEPEQVLLRLCLPARCLLAEPQGAS